MSSETINAGQGTIIAVGNGNNTVNVIGGSNDTISIGSGTNNLTVTGGTGDTITAGNGNDTITVTGGSNNIITVGSGNDTLVASGDHNDSINLGMGNDTVYLGADDTVHMGKGSELLVLPPSTPVLAAAPITVTEDQTISLATLGISASLSQFGFGFENIYGFAAADQLEFTTAQFANFQAVMAAATQVGQNTVITDTAADTITLENVAKSTLAAKNFVFVNAASSSGNLLVTMSGLPSDLSNFNGGTYNANTGTWTGTAAQFNALTFSAGEETTAQLTLTATDTATGYSISKNIALTITPPTITIAVTGNPQEGQTLTAHVTVSNGDAFTYQWQSSTDGTHWSNIANATGMSYLVQESDETRQLRVKITLVDDGYSVASAATAAVLDNSSLSLTVSVVGNLPVQQGQTLVASVIPGDADDASAPVTYQWQSSSDGGQTWTNVAATAAGNFANGVPSSFYQMTESDEGKVFRATASFTDDTGQVVSTTSAQTVPVADITPEITIPFSYAVDNLSIVKNGTQIYTNSFAVAPPASPTILSNGTPTPIVFITEGSTWSESGGKAIASSTGVALNPHISGGNSAFDLALLNTNTDPTSTLGLKQGADFTVSSTFDLVTPPTGSYGMELTDGTLAHPIDQLERLIVQRVSGNAVVELIQANLDNQNTQTVLASYTLTAADLAGNNQIEFQFAHTANTTSVTGTFELINNGTVTSTTTFSPAASIFTNGVNWTRADVGAFTNTGVGLNVAPGQAPREGQTLTASASTNDSDATLHYQWQKSNNNFASFTVIGTDNPSYVVQEPDEGFSIRVVASTTDPDNSQTTSVISVTTGPVLDRLPTVTTPVITGTAQEGQTLTASASSGESDDPVTYAWYSSADGYTSAIGFGATYLVKETDEGFTLEAKATAANDGGLTATATSAATSAVVDAAPTVTTPVITGTAQEGQTLTASAQSGEADDPVTYAWYSSADGYTNAVGFGASYQVKETDEGFTLEAKATATNDNGVTISATSTTSVVVDAAPTVTTPIIGGMAREGQTLTASASAGEGDDPVTYTWYNSADGYTNPIGTGATYVVQEGDENATIEVKATATNDNGATASATSAASSKVLDNSSLALSVSVVANGSVQQGQTLVASATPGDADDTGSPVAYQWQSSSDGGQTWTDVSGALAGNFANGQPSSFYQLSEGDEGKVFRATASFTDDTGQAVSATSSPTVPVADVTPEISIPFSYSVSDLSIVKNGTQIYNNDFSVAPPASPTILSSGVPTPIVFITQGSTWTETGGKAIASSTGVAPNPNVSGSTFDLALLNTNTDPASTSGLKEGVDFTVSSIFDLVAPPTGSYGMELTDGTATHGVDQLERLLVQRVSGAAVVELIQANLTTNTQTVLDSHTLTAAELAGNNQIEFQFSHSANTTAVTGTFELIHNGTVTSTTTFSPTASIFTNGVDWTRADVGAFTNPGVGLNFGPGQSPREGQTLTASAATNDSDAALHYQWQKSTDNFQTFTPIGTDSPNYVVQEPDEGFSIRVVASTTDPDNSQTATVTSVVTGPVLDALPTVTTPVIGGTAQEGQTLSASASSGESDDPVTYAWYSSADGDTNPIGFGATYVVQEGDENHQIEVKATARNDGGLTVTATSAATAAVLDALPTVTTPTISGTAQEGQTLTASASSGESDDPVTYAWYSSADGDTNPIGFGATYVVQEGDENHQIEVKATARNDGGLTVTATSAATAPVLDALPTVTTPVISGTAQEGQTLSASAQSGESDDPVTYAWYSSADNYTNPIGTGATYVVQATDETFNIEVKATATNDDGATASATSTPTSAVLGGGFYVYTTLNAPGASQTYPSAINDSGQVAGYSYNGGNSYPGFIYSSGSYTTINVPGASETIPEAINASGQVAGFSYNGSNDIGFIYSNGSFTVLSPPAGFSGTVALGINDSGQVVGYSYGNTDQGFIYSNGSLTTLNVPGSSETIAYAINNFGEVAGYYYNGSTDRGFIYSNGNFTTFNVPGASGTAAFAINDSGQVTGYSWNGNTYTGFIYSNGSLTTFNAPGASETIPQAINASGQVAGYASNGDQGFIYSNGSLTTLNVPGASYTTARGINASAQVVGYYNDASGEHGFLATDPPGHPTNVNAGATVELGSAATDAVVFAGATGTLQLDQSTSFTGTVAGFAAQDQIDLADIAFSPGTTLGYAGNADNSAGTLSVSDGSNMANIALLGSYMASTFAIASDGHGGTLVSDVAPSQAATFTAPPLPTALPHA